VLDTYSELCNFATECVGAFLLILSPSSTSNYHSVMRGKSKKATLFHAEFSFCHNPDIYTDTERLGKRLWNWKEVWAESVGSRRRTRPS